MKKNTQKAAEFVQIAMRQLGEDFSLNKARSYLSAALNEIIRVQNKREKREDNIKKNEAREKEKKFLSYEEAKRRLKELDKMLETFTRQNESDQS